MVAPYKFMNKQKHPKPALGDFSKHCTVYWFVQTFLKQMQILKLAKGVIKTLFC